MKDLVRFRLDVDHMTQSIRSAVRDHQGVIVAEIEQVVSEYVKGEGFSRDIREWAEKSAREVIRQRVEWAIRDAVRESTEIADMCRKAVDQALAPGFKG